MKELNPSKLKRKKREIEASTKLGELVKEKIVNKFLSKNLSTLRKDYLDYFVTMASKAYYNDAFYNTTNFGGSVTNIDLSFFIRCMKTLGGFGINNLYKANGLRITYPFDFLFLYVQYDHEQEVQIIERYVKPFLLNTYVDDVEDFEEYEKRSKKIENFISNTSNDNIKAYYRLLEELELIGVGYFPLKEGEEQTHDSFFSIVKSIMNEVKIFPDENNSYYKAKMIADSQRYGRDVMSVADMGFIETLSSNVESLKHYHSMIDIIPEIKGYTLSNKYRFETHLMNLAILEAHHYIKKSKYVLKELKDKIENVRTDSVVLRAERAYKDIEYELIVLQKYMDFSEVVRNYNEFDESIKDLVLKFLHHDDKTDSLFLSSVTLSSFNQFTRDLVTKTSLRYNISQLTQKTSQVANMLIEALPVRKVNKDDLDWGETVMEFGNGFFMEMLEEPYSAKEGEQMGHCGNSPRANSSDTIYSLRRRLKKNMFSVHVTITVHSTGFVIECKGYGNSEPSEDYKKMLVEFYLKNKNIINAEAGLGWLPDNDFRLYNFYAITIQDYNNIEGLEYSINMYEEKLKYMPDGESLSIGDSHDQDLKNLDELEKEYATTSMTTNMKEGLYIKIEKVRRKIAKQRIVERINNYKEKINYIKTFYPLVKKIKEEKEWLINKNYAMGIVLNKNTLVYDTEWDFYEDLYSAWYVKEKYDGLAHILRDKHVDLDWEFTPRNFMLFEEEDSRHSYAEKMSASELVTDIVFKNKKTVGNSEWISFLLSLDLEDEEVIERIGRSLREADFQMIESYAFSKIEEKVVNYIKDYVKIEKREDGKVNITPNLDAFTDGEQSILDVLDSFENEYYSVSSKFVEDFLADKIDHENILSDRYEYETNWSSDFKTYGDDFYEVIDNKLYENFEFSFDEYKEKSK